MDNKVMDKIHYGMYLLSTKVEGRKNGCIINTCMQLTTEPMQIAVAVLNVNLSCDMIKESGLFTLSILDESVTYETISHFGMQSGRNIDKFEGMKTPEDNNGIPYIEWAACGMLSCKVVNQFDFGSHTLFVAEVTDGKMLSNQEPVTYAQYHKDIKPKPEKIEQDRVITGWRCKICGYIYEGSTLPDDYICPLCGHGIEDFEPIYQ